MAKAQKFGTFGGVFTPSLLTILGVIMYLRLGWIVGQAGLIYAVGIILIAHIISVTTGLSLSSIATDKKIRAGGIYYMLSRSLGLSIGGAIGVTIFIAMALSIALYIVGFSESFLSVDVIREFTGLEQNLTSYRILGISILVVLIIIAFISTSLAIKLQYFVLTAIALSLISIIAGLFINTGFHPANISISPSTTAPSMDVLFAVFFPAVTGFTVGVSMSGDLKNPRSSIPQGTMLSIFTGLIVYLALAIGFAVFVDRELLLNDAAFLQKISVIPVLVLAGIWGATLSSALGSILGGPRIIQAVAKDKLAPSYLSKGFGINNEPRVAIILTFVIAAGGILIGDLNTIARVVSMFFIAAYGFINLAFALEKWASTDFRPYFKVPGWVGWIGFAASIIVMIQIDVVAMFIAFILIWATWYLMKKREQRPDLGDVWQSVWSNVIRHSLFKMNAKGIEERNWKPNIMLFSGNPHTREKLIELGKALISNHGLLTIINLEKVTPGQKIQSRFKQNLVTPENLSEKGIFTRVYPCTDIYEGIENLAQTYGFAGVEPNTVLMGWTRSNTEKEKFATLIKHIINMDHNILLMDYDMEKGFGKRKTIDIWWRGSGNNGNLAINLVKFLWLSNEWKDSKTRLMIENPVNEERDNIFNFARKVLDNLRVNAEINIINNEIEKKPFFDIIRVESSDSDIIFLGVPEIEDGKETEFVEQTHALCNDLGTVVLIKASTQFKRLNIGLTAQPAGKLSRNMITSTQNELGVNIKWPDKKMAEDFCKKLYEDIQNINFELRSKVFGKIFRQYNDILGNSFSRVNTTFNIIEKKILEEQNAGRENYQLSVLYKLINNSFIRYEHILNGLSEKLLDEQEKNLEISLSGLTVKFENLLSEVPEKLILNLNKEEITPNKNDNLALKVYKWRKRNIEKEKAKQRISIHKLVRKFYPGTWHLINRKVWQKFSNLSLQYLIEQQSTFNQFRDSLQIIETSLENNTFSHKILAREKEKIAINFNKLQDFLNQAEENLFKIAEEENIRSIQSICNALEHPHVNSIIGKQKPAFKIRKYEIREMELWPSIWKENQKLQINHDLLELTLSAVDYKSWHFMKRADYELQKLSEGDNRIPCLDLSEQITAFAKESISSIAKNQSPPEPAFSIIPGKDLYRRIKDIEDYTLEKISTAISRVPSNTRLIKNKSHADMASLQSGFPETEIIEVSRLLHFIIQSDLVTPFQQHLKNYSDKLEESEQNIAEIAQLIKFTLTGDEEDPGQLPKEDFFTEQKQRVAQVITTLQDETNELDDKLQAILNKISSQFSIPVFLKIAENMRLFVKSKEAEKQKENWIKMQFNKGYDFLRRNLVKIWFDRSKRIVYAYQTKGYQNEDYFPVSRLHS
ncbi:MAG: hypothetical protein ABR597_13435, partial [Bacteroidales bacterium]